MVHIGNRSWQDDHAGVVAQQLEEVGIPCKTEMVLTVGFEVMDTLKGYDRTIIVDACLLRWRAWCHPCGRRDDIFTTHALGNSHAVILGTTLKPGSICFPKEMLLELAQGAEVVVERIEAMVGEKVVIG